MRRRERTRVSVAVDEAQLERAICLLRRAKYLNGLPNAERNELNEEDRRLISMYERTQMETQGLIDACRESERIGHGYNIVVNCR